MMLWVLVGVIAMLTLAVGVLWAGLTHLKSKERDLTNQLLTRKGEAEELMRQLSEANDRKVAAETKYDSLLEQVSKLEKERLDLMQAKEQANDARHEAEKRERGIVQQLVDKEKEMENWEKTKQQHMEAARASVLKASSEISSKLLDDHKREAEVAKKESEKQVKETTEKLHAQFDDVFKSMGVLHDKVKRVEVVERSLLSPSGAGILAETTLANIFKNSSLNEGTDYMMQYSIAGEGLRPDAVVFLPDGVMVIDSKASKFFLEIEKAENEEEKQSLQQQLKKTMNDHLKGLVSRNYRQAVEEQLKKTGRAVDARKVRVYMFLPTEVAVGKLREIDGKFEEKAYKEGIYPVGPVGLVNALLNAQLFIDRVMQEQNSQRIMDEVKELLGSVAKLHELSQGIGKRAKSTVESYDKFAASFNRTFLSKVRKLGALGAGGGVSLPQLERYEVDSKRKLIDGTIEDEAEEAGEIKPIIKELALEEA